MKLNVQVFQKCLGINPQAKSSSLLAADLDLTYLVPYKGTWAFSHVWKT